MFPENPNYEKGAEAPFSFTYQESPLHFHNMHLF